MRAFAIEVARLLADRHCEDVRLLDVRGLSQVCDFVLIGTGTSDRQMKSLAQELDEFGRQQGQPMFRADSDAAVTWVVVDFVGLVAHLFEPGQRAVYDLEGLWSDAPSVAWERAGAGASGRPEKELS
jgi:ribosome-associated protein